MTFSEIAHKKVAGVPVLYLAGAFVAILALVAWKMKPSASEDPADVPDAANPGEEPDNNPDGYAGLATNGTVTVVQPTPEKPEPIVVTNDMWGADAIKLLIGDNKATAGDAQAAISKYLAGDALSFAEGELRDYAVSKKGPPPDYIGTSTVTGSKPAQKQGNPPCKHTVKGTNDNGLTELAALYYGRSDLSATGLLAGANGNLPRYGAYDVGTVVVIPAWHEPRYFTTTSAVRYHSSIASKNGISVAALENMNPNLPNPVAVGVKVRVG